MPGTKPGMTSWWVAHCAHNYIVPVSANMPSSLGPKPRLGYADSRLERAAELRSDEAALAKMAADPSAGAYVVGGDLVVMKKGAPLNQPFFTIAEAQALAPATETVFLGHLDGAGQFGHGIPQATAEALKARDDLLITDLRSIAVQGLVAPEHLPPIAQAKAVLHWHARHRFCPNCGAPTLPVQGGWKRDCANCKTEHFPRTDPVVIMLAVDKDFCLLGRSPRFVPTMWSCLAGFIEPGESFEDAVHRETKEEAGITCGQVRYFRSQPWPFPSSLMIGCHAQALSREIVIDKTELEDARWFSKAEAETMLLRKHPQGLTAPPPMAIAHHIIRAWVEGEVSFD
ncbi:MAG: NAD(+) diphosphatase [Pseudolabrys sp.]